MGTEQAHESTRLDSSNRWRYLVEIPNCIMAMCRDSVATDLEEPSGSDLMAQLVVNQGRRGGFFPTRSGLSSGVCPHLINLTPDRDSTSLAYAMSTPCLAE